VVVIQDTVGWFGVVSSSFSALFRLIALQIHMMTIIRIVVPVILPNTMEATAPADLWNKHNVYECFNDEETTPNQPTVSCITTTNLHSMFYRITYKTEVNITKGPLWLRSYGSWIYNYLCNQYISPLTLWVRIPPRRGVLDGLLIIFCFIAPDCITDTYDDHYKNSCTRDPSKYNGGNCTSWSMK
jgi:hypothetical protein